MRCVFPTHVGVYLGIGRPAALHSSFPHACGGVPAEFHPEAWDVEVFPTHVGVYLLLLVVKSLVPGFPHACGGVPLYFSFIKQVAPFSPRMWGCTVSSLIRARCSRVFPTHVGVYLGLCPHLHIQHSFPHACGGVPPYASTDLVASTFSPRMWGCTLVSKTLDICIGVFPTHVGVYLYGTNRSSNLNRFPHACGGVPRLSPRSRVKAGFSPRMWGCTFVSAVAPASAAVFPTHVGVYLSNRMAWILASRFPHACGGVPNQG